MIYTTTTTKYCPQGLTTRQATTLVFDHLRDQTLQTISFNPIVLPYYPLSASPFKRPAHQRHHIADVDMMAHLGASFGYF